MRMPILRTIVLGLACIAMFIFTEVSLQTYEKLNKTMIELKKADDKLTEFAKENEQLKKALQECKGSKAGIKQTHLKGIISSVLVYLGEKNPKDWTRLLCLTIATESNMGQFTKQMKGPARGITQVEPSTEREVLAWLHKYHPKTFEHLRKLRVPAKLGIHEAEYNMAYSIGLCYGVYRMRKVNPSKKSTKELAALYKKYYNTYKGKATVDGVMTKLIAYNVKL